MITTREGSVGFSSAAFAPRALALAIAVAIAFYAVAGLAEASLIRVLRPSEMERDWISDVVLSSALGVSIYLWLHLRATRLALTEHERAQVIVDAVREGRSSARTVCGAVMSEAREAHGPTGVEHWADDLTVVVVSVRK